MKHFRKIIMYMTAAYTAAILICFTGISVSAADLKLEFVPVKSNGDELYALEYQTAIQDNNKFDPRTMTEDSQVIVEFDCEDPPSDKCAVVLIWQSWGPHPSPVNNWSRISPAEYDDTRAVFNYEDIVSRYGSSDFSQVYTVLVSDTGSPVTLKSVTITALDIPEEEAAVSEETEESVSEEEVRETLPVTVPSSVSETTVQETEALPVTEQPPEQETSKSSTAVVIVIVLLIIAAASAGAVLILRKKHRHSNRFY